MLLHLFDAIEVIPPKPFRPTSSVVALEIGVLLWLSGLDVDQTDLCFLCPRLELSADIFSAITHVDGQRLIAPSNDLVQGPDLPPEAPSFITRVCRSGFHILRLRNGQARRARSPHLAQASGARLRVLGFQAMSAA